MTEEPRATLVERLYSRAIFEDYIGSAKDAGELLREAADALASISEPAREEEPRGLARQLANWCDGERAKLGALDGYDYLSGEEYGLRRAQIQAEKLAAQAEEGKEPAGWLDNFGHFWRTEEAAKKHNARPLYAAPSSSTLEITEEAVEAARQSLYRNPDIRAALEASLPFLSQTGGEKSDA